MKALILALTLLVSLQDLQTPKVPKPKFSVSPRVAPEPATVTFLLMNIPQDAKVACFVLDGENHYQSCRELEGEKSYRLEHKNVFAGEYLAGVLLDEELVGNPVAVIITE